MSHTLEDTTELLPDGVAWNVKRLHSGNLV